MSKIGEAVIVGTFMHLHVPRTASKGHSHTGKFLFLAAPKNKNFPVFQRGHEIFEVQESTMFKLAYLFLYI